MKKESAAHTAAALRAGNAIAKLGVEGDGHEAAMRLLMRRFRAQAAREGMNENDIQKLLEDDHVEATLRPKADSEAAETTEATDTTDTVSTKVN